MIWFGFYGFNGIWYHTSKTFLNTTLSAAASGFMSFLILKWKNCDKDYNHYNI